MEFVLGWGFEGVEFFRLAVYLAWSLWVLARGWKPRWIEFWMVRWVLHGLWVLVQDNSILILRI